MVPGPIGPAGGGAFVQLRCEGSKGGKMVSLTGVAALCVSGAGVQVCSPGEVLVEGQQGPPWRGRGT